MKISLESDLSNCYYSVKNDTNLTIIFFILISLNKISIIILKIT